MTAAYRLHCFAESGNCFKVAQMLALTGSLWYPEETGIDLGRFPNLLAWRERIAALPGWKHPYELMPRGVGA